MIPKRRSSLPLLLATTVTLVLLLSTIMVTVDGLQQLRRQRQQHHQQQQQHSTHHQIVIIHEQRQLLGRCSSRITQSWMTTNKQYIPMDDFTILDDDNNNDDDSTSATTAPTKLSSSTTMSWMDRNSNYASGNNDNVNDGGSTSNKRRSTSSSSSSFDRSSTSTTSRNSFRTNASDSYRDGSIKLSSSSSKTFRQDFRGTRVFVQNIAKHTSWQTLKDHFRTIILNENNNNKENNSNEKQKSDFNNNNNNNNKNSIVIYASISIDTITGMSKGHGIVQFETTDMAQYAVQHIRYHPLDGNILYVRPDVQESTKSIQQQEQWELQQRISTTRRPVLGGQRTNNFRESTTSTNIMGKWNCANDPTDIDVLINTDTYRSIEQMLQARDDARKRKNFIVSDNIREQLKIDHTVHLDDRLRMWWIDSSSSMGITNNNRNGDSTSSVPQRIQDMKGSGRWTPKKLEEWRQIPTTIENDSCVDSNLVMALLQQRDIARREKDFKKADRLLEQARTSPSDNNLFLRIHDESRTWRIWTTEKPSPLLLHGPTNYNNNNPKRRNNDTTGSSRRGISSYSDDYDNDNNMKNNNNNNNSRQDLSSYSQLSASEQCIEFIQQIAPDKVNEIQNLLEKFPGREWNILKKLKQRYE
jgi:cysteinyl-tRNA synthetase